MHSKVFKRGPTTPSMNITPLIDVVFQLVIFFMLVNNIIGEESVRMIVPRLDEARTYALGEVDRLVVNIVPQPFDAAARAADPLDFDGTPAGIKVGLQWFSFGELAAVTEALAAARRSNPKVEVVLRADSALYFDSIQPVLAAVAAAGIEKVDLVAALPEGLAAQVDVGSMGGLP
jgi:biopolymer transport protein ExbD